MEKVTCISQTRPRGFPKELEKILGSATRGDKARWDEVRGRTGAATGTHRTVPVNVHRCKPRYTDTDTLHHICRNCQQRSGGPP